MLDFKNVEKAASETGIDAAYVEKDWYAVQLLKSLNSFSNDYGVELVFSGGTSLSKGFGIIERFSEDLDFILQCTDPISAGKRRTFRKSVISHINSEDLFDIDDDDVERGDSYRFFKAPIQYDRKFEHDSLRPYIQLEMTFSEPRLPLFKQQDIRSIISEISGNDSDTKMTCISPIETASDKISALTWRVIVRDRSSDDHDPTLIRHLHDLAALEDTILSDITTFKTCAQQSLEHDQQHRGGDVIAKMSISDRLDKAYYHLWNHKIYYQEYMTFVQRMSYADDEDQISFSDAMLALKKIILLLQP
jgi:predicted nucleotidyltransferase component of viral defense system